MSLGLLLSSAFGIGETKNLDIRSRVLLDGIKYIQINTEKYVHSINYY